MPPQESSGFDILASHVFAHVPAELTDSPMWNLSLRVSSPALQRSGRDRQLVCEYTQDLEITEGLPGQPSGTTCLLLHAPYPVRWPRTILDCLRG